MARPKSENTKDIHISIRVTKENLEKLDYCCEKLNKTRTDVLIRGLELVVLETEKGEKKRSLLTNTGFRATMRVHDKGGETLPKKDQQTDDLKSLGMRFRLSEEDVMRLQYCAEATGQTKSEIIRQGIKEIYERLKEQEQPGPC